VLEGGQRMGEAATTPRGLTHRHCPTKVLATALEGAVDEPRWLLVLLLLNRLVVVLKWLVLVELHQLGFGLLDGLIDIIPVGRDERREVLVRGERHEEQHELDEDYYDLPDQTNNSSRGGGRATRRTTTKKISVKKWVHRLTDEKFFRATYDTKNDRNWTRRTTTTCQTKQTTRRAGGGRYVVCGTTKNVSVKKWVHRLADEKLWCVVDDTRNDRNWTRRTGATWTKGVAKRSEGGGVLGAGHNAE
jgi:hypothetical protein